MRFVTSQVAAPGINVQNEDAIMTLDTSLTCLRGDVLVVKQTVVDASLRYSVVKEPLTADFTTASGAANVEGWHCIALEDQATAAGNVRCRFVGEVDALISDNSLAIGAKLTPSNASRALKTQVLTGTGPGAKGVAILLEATTSTNQIKRVYFDGVSNGGVGRAITAT